MAERTLHTPLTDLPGVGPARARALDKLGLSTVADLLAYFPREYEDRTVREGIARLPADTPVCFAAVVAEPFRTSYIRKGMELTKGRIVDGTGQAAVTFFNQNYVRKALQPGQTYFFYGTLTGEGYRRSMVNPAFEREGAHQLTGGIFPVYPLTAGITNRFLTGLVRAGLACLPQVQETLGDDLRETYDLVSVEQAYGSIHFPASWEALTKARRRLMFEELFCLNLGLTLIRGRRGEQRACPFVRQDLEGFTSRLPFSLTPAQLRSVKEAAADLRRAVPMNRLLQGDVGSGKTVVAAACAYFAWQNGCQAALMAPTELLAQQHQRTMETLLAGTGLRVGLLVGSMTAAQKRDCRADLAAGALDLIVGTHALLSEGVSFRRLGLVITDEQHRFGVDQRAALAAKSGEKDRPHVLVMSATPIPRTLNMALSGLRDMSTLEQPPTNRQPVQTYVLEHDWGLVADAIRRELDRGGQVYYLHNRTETIDRTAAKLRALLGESVRIATAHGKMDQEQLGDIMSQMTDGELDILVCTTIIETGIDLPNVNTLIIENAETFGLAQLHQLRGRVGRSTRRAAAYLTYRPSKVLTEDQSKRLSAIREYAAFGSGFKIAMRDLEIRGAGNLLGPEQSGFLMSVGYDLYLRLLEEAVLEEQGKPVVRETLCTADFAVAAAIPERYIPAPEQRMDLYRRIARVRTQEEGDDITDELIDRYGDPPVGVANLIAIALLRARAAALGITELVQKEGSLRFSLPQPDFAKVAAVCGLEKYKGRLLFSAGDKPYLSLRLKKGDDVLKLAGIVLRDFEAAG